MFFSTRGGKRGLVISAVAVAALSVTGCSSDDSSLEDAKSSPDAAAADAAAAVEDLVDRYWAAVVEAENSADDDPDQFDEVANGPFVEGLLKKLRDYDEAGIRRVGEPDITKVEVAITADTADIMLCLNEDDWTAEQDGKPMKAPAVLGPKPWGAEAKKEGDAWLISDVRLPSEGAKKC